MLRRSLTARETVVVHTADGRTVAGVLVGRHRDALVLAHARYLSEGGLNVPMDGETIVPAANVALVQRSVVIDDVKALQP